MNKKRLTELIRFCLVGGLSFLVDTACLYICTEYLKIYYLLSAGMAFTVSVIFNYWLCVTFVFNNIGKQTAKQKSLFIGSSIAGLAINQICMYAFVEIFGIYYMFSKVLATAIVTVWNYVMKRKAIVG